MKKLLTFLLAVIISMSFSNLVFAFPQTLPLSNTEYTYFPDGSYIISVIADEPSNNNLYTTYARTATKSKTSTYYSNSNVKLWYVKVTGTFTYNTKLLPAQILKYLLKVIAILGKLAISPQVNLVLLLQPLLLQSNTKEFLYYKQNKKL